MQLDLSAGAGPAGLPVAVSGLRVWNYNKSAEDASRGARHVAVFLDGMALTPPGGAALRKAPGVDGADFGQTIQFADGRTRRTDGQLGVDVEAQRSAALAEAATRPDHNLLVSQVTGFSRSPVLHLSPSPSSCLAALHSLPAPALHRASTPHCSRWAALCRWSSCQRMATATTWGSTDWRSCPRMGPSCPCPRQRQLLSRTRATCCQARPATIHARQTSC